MTTILCKNTETRRQRYNNGRLTVDYAGLLDSKSSSPAKRSHLKVTYNLRRMPTEIKGTHRTIIKKRPAALYIIK